MSLARTLRQWLTVTIPQGVSTWLLHSYRRPLGLFVGVIVVPFLLIVGATYQASVALWRRQTMENLRVTARLGAEILNETLEQTLLLEQLVATQPDLLDAVERADSPASTRLLDEAFRFIRRINQVMVVSPEGQVLAAAPGSQDIVGMSIADRESFQAPKQLGWQPAVSGVYVGEGSELKRVVSISWPMRREQRVVGLLQVEQRIEEIKSWLQKIRVEPKGFLYVADQHDQLVVFPYQMIPGRPMVVASWPPVAQPLGEAGATLMFTSAKTGERWLAGVYPVGRLGWRVVTVQPERAALRTLRRVFGVLGFLVLVAVGLVAAVGSRWLKVHAFSLEVLQQNARILKQLQQRRFYGQGGDDPLTENPEPPS